MARMVISEKNKAAQAIAEGLGPVQKIQYGQGITVYAVKTQDTYVIPLRGHIQQYENTSTFEKWTDRDPREIITDPHSIEKIPIQYAGPYIKILKEFAQKCNECIIGTDADVEGCNIGLMDAWPFVHQANPKIQIRQLWLSDLQKKSVQAAFSNLISPKWSWAESGEARAIVDALIGFAATREVSLTLKPLLKAIGVQFASIGRVQTCLLYLLFEREQLIRDFHPTPFWTISAELIHGVNLLIAQHLNNNFTDKIRAEAIYQKIQMVKIATIKDIKQSKSLISVPTPLNTNKALILVTQKLGLSAEQALKTMEDLYLNKIISYPRTDSDVYPAGYNHLSLLQDFLTHPEYGPFTHDLLSNKRTSPKQGHQDTQDHPPISPLQSLPLNSNQFENAQQRDVYDLLSRHYLALFGEPGEEAETKILVDIGTEPFITKNSILIKPGFLKIAPFLGKKYDIPLQLNSTTKSFPVKRILLEEKQTQPPPRFTDSTLLKLMDQKNIGTKSTRPTIIQILLDRQYVDRRQHSFFVKELGYQLMINLQQVWLPFLEPQFTAEVEQRLESIRQNQRQMQEVVEELRHLFLDLFDKFRLKKADFIKNMDQIRQIGNVTRGKGNKIIDSQKKEIHTTSFCPQCKKNLMKLVKTQQKKQFLACSDPQCKSYLTLPQSGSIHVLKKTCSLCGFNIIRILTHKNKRKIQYYICPLCWTQGLKSKTGEGFCANCKSYKIEKDNCVKK